MAVFVHSIRFDSICFRYLFVNDSGPTATLTEISHLNGHAT